MASGLILVPLCCSTPAGVIVFGTRKSSESSPSAVGCSTPAGVIVFGTRSCFSMADWPSAAQRPRASSSLAQAEGRSAPTGGTGCSTPAGVIVFGTPVVALDAFAADDLLNARGRHRLWHQGRGVVADKGSCCSTPAGVIVFGTTASARAGPSTATAQRLRASSSLAPSPGRAAGRSLTCSTPAGVIVFGTRRRRRWTAVGISAQRPRASSSLARQRLVTVDPTEELLNARGRHRLWHIVILTPLLDLLLCSTPAGVIVFGTPPLTQCRPAFCSAQRPRASTPAGVIVFGTAEAEAERARWETAQRPRASSSLAPLRGAMQWLKNIPAQRPRASSSLAHPADEPIIKGR